MKAIMCFLFILVYQLSFAQEDGEIKSQVQREELPIPKEKGQLFYLQRDPDANTVVYTVNLESGLIDDEDPVSIYWIRYTEESQRENLSFIQRRMAYGIKHKKVGPQTFELRLQAYKSLLITLSPQKTSGKYQATVQIKGKTVIIEHFFVRIKGGSFFKPNVEYIEIFGHSVDTGQEISHRFIPE